MYCLYIIEGRPEKEQVTPRSFNDVATIEVECKLLNVSSFNHILPSKELSNPNETTLVKVYLKPADLKHTKISHFVMTRTLEFYHHNCMLIFNCTIKTVVQFEC